MATSVKDGCRFTDDLEREILVRLPVVSLLRFKCVCKSWYPLINNPSFIREHLGNNRGPQLLIYDRYADIDDPVQLSIISEDKLVAKFNHDFRGQEFGDLLILIGSVDGLFLLQKGCFEDASLTLWNPATREVRPLPVFKFVIHPISLPCSCMFGFGLDPFTSNNYKVICLRIVIDFQVGDDMIIRGYAEVYSSSTDSWRTLQPVNNKIINNEIDFFEEGAYLNGAYYWILNKGGKISILSFDFGSEVFGETDGPHFTSYSYLNFTSLILVDDNSAIAILNSNAVRSVYDIWVLSIQPGAAGVWNKLLTFQCPYPIANPCYYGLWDSSTLIFLREEEIIGRGFRLVSYDVRTRETRHLGYRHQGQKRGVSVYYYKESLVTIKQRGRELDKGSAIEQEELK